MYDRHLFCKKGHFTGYCLLARPPTHYPLNITYTEFFSSVFKYSHYTFVDTIQMYLLDVINLDFSFYCNIRSFEIVRNTPIIKYIVNFEERIESVYFQQNQTAHGKFHISKQTFTPTRCRGRVLTSSTGRPGFNPQSRTASYQRRYKNGTSSTLIQHSTLKREKLALSQELRQELNVMDKIWDRKPSKSEVIGRCGGDEKNE